MKYIISIGCAVLLLLTIQFAGCSRTEVPTFPKETSITANKAVFQKANNCDVPSSIIHWWPGDGNADDIVGGNDGTLFGGASFRAGQVGQAFDLTGPQDYIDAANPLSFPAGQDFTIAFWVNQGQVAPSGAGWLIEARRGTFLGFAIIARSTDIVLGGRCDNSSFGHSVFADFSTGQWQHYTAVVDWTAQEIRVYIDGVQDPNVGDLAAGPCDGFTSGNKFRIGHIGATSLFQFNFNGLIDEVQVFNTALTETEIEALLCRVITIDIDIKPGSDPNSINPTSGGIIPVAVLTDENFDATTIDVSTIAFGPNEAKPVHNGHIEDVDDDGDDDLVLHFNTQETGIQCGDTEATLTGETLGGQAVEGTDSVNTVGCKKI